MARLQAERSLWLARNIIPHEPALRVWLGGRRVPGLDVDDIVQETYAKLAALESVSGIHNPRAYFFQTAHSVIFSHLRRSQIVSIRAVEDVELWRIESEEASPERQVSDRDELQRIAEVLASLPKQVALTFSLRRIEGLSQRETARRLGVTESTVEKHLSKSLKLFMDALGRRGFEVRGASKSSNAKQRSDHGTARDK